MSVIEITGWVVAFMSKGTYAKIVIGLVGALLFSLGLCFCLIPEWNGFTIGVIMTIAGAIVLLALFGRPIVSSMSATPIERETLHKIIYIAVAVLVFGFGMALVFAWDNVVVGSVVGIAGLAMLLGFAPLFGMLKD